MDRNSIPKAGFWAQMSKSQSASPLDKTSLQPLMQRSDAVGLIRIFQHFLAVAITVVLLAGSDNWMMQGALTLALGILLTFLFAPLHETIHKTAFATPLLNEIVGWVCAMALALPPKYFQAFHMAHHRYTQIAGKDPELDFDKPQTVPQYIRHLSGADYWLGQAKALTLFAIGHHHTHFVNDAKRPGIVNEARIFTGIYVLLFSLSLLFDSTILWQYWILPMLVGQPFLRAFLLAEHTLCPYVTDMLQNTRTTLTIRGMRWLSWNMSFHAEHHAYPAIPFHHLPAAHAVIGPHIDMVSDGYVDVQKDIIRALRSLD